MSSRDEIDRNEGGKTTYEIARDLADSCKDEDPYQHFQKTYTSTEDREVIWNLYWKLVMATRKGGEA